MNGSEYLFESIGQISDRYVLEVDAALGLSGRKKRSGSKKLWRTVLIAAVITALMGVTAYATGLLGLKDRVAPIGEAEMYVTTKDGETGEVRDELQNVPVAVGSPNGVTGSPEYQATQEWFAFMNEYEAQREAAGNKDWRDYEGGFIKNERERAIAGIYRAWNRTTMDKLMEIAGKYELRLLTEETSLIFSEEALRGIVGINPFIKQDESEFHYGYCFEDGSFKVEGCLMLNGQEVIYEICRIMSGCLFPYTYYWVLDTEYEEWEYVTADGQTVNIVVTRDLMSDDETDYCLKAFFDRDGAFVEITGIVYTNSGEAVDYRALAETLADSFDLDALTLAESSGMETSISGRDDGAESDAGRLYAAFVSSPEYLAGIEYGFSRGYGDEIGGQDAENARMIAEKYGLTAPKSQKVMDVSGETLECLGMGRFMDASSCWGEIMQYDNGGFCINARSDMENTGPLVEYQIQYIPKGALNPLVLFAGQTQFWRFDTACGAQVAMAKDTANDICWAIWETDHAWVVLDTNAGILSAEAIVDNIDWTSFS